jgi:hypothetical protein
MDPENQSSGLDDPNFVAAMNALGSNRPQQAMEAQGSQSGLDDPKFIAAMNALGSNEPNSSKPAAKRSSAPGTAMPAGPARHTAPRPSMPAPGMDLRNASAQDVLKSAAKNFLPNAGENLKGIWDAVTHYKQTGQGIANLAGGVGAQLGHKILGMDYDPKDAQKVQMARALEKQYGDVYMPALHGDFGPLKQEFGTRPFSTMSDLSMFAGVPGAGLKGVGMLAKAGSGAARIAGATAAANRAAALAKGLKVAGNVASAPAKMIDPLYLGTKLASGIAGGAGAVARGAHSGLSGVDPALLEEISKAGNAPLGERSRGFLATNMGIANPTDTQIRFKKALSTTNGKEYAAHRENIQGMQGEPEFGVVHNAIDEAHNALSPGSAIDPTLRGRLVGDAHDALDLVRQELLDHEARAAAGMPGYGGIEGVDRLKRQIYEAAQNAKGSTKNALMDVHNTVRNALGEANPLYSDAMETAQENINRAQDIAKTLGTGNKTAASNAVNKGLRAIKNPRGKSMMEDLSREDPSLLARLAGHATSDLGVPDLGNLFRYSSLPRAAAIAALGSPKLAGLIHYGAGMAGAGMSTAAKAGRAAEFLTPDQQSKVGPEADALQEQGPQAFIQNQTIANKAPSDDPELDEAMEGLHARETMGTDASGQTKPYLMRGPEINDPSSMYYGQKAMGTYQIMPGNLKEWSTEAAKAGVIPGPVTEDEFMKNEDLQEKIARFKVKQLLDKYHNMTDVRSVWFTGRPFKEAHGRSDTHHTVEQYVAPLPGERPGRASGGRIDKGRHEFLVNRLIKMAKDAKTVSDKTTEPLLNAPDTAVVKALDIAQRAI